MKSKSCNLFAGTTPKPQGGKAPALYDVPTSSVAALCGTYSPGNRLLLSTNELLNIISYIILLTYFIFLS